MEQFSENWTLAAIRQAAREFLWTNFGIHLLVSTYTKESMIIKDEVFNGCVVILCIILIQP